MSQGILGTARPKAKHLTKVQLAVLSDMLLEHPLQLTLAQVRRMLKAVQPGAAVLSRADSNKIEAAKVFANYMMPSRRATQREATGRIRRVPACRPK